MQALLKSETRDAAKEQLLSDIAQWCAANAKRLNSETLFREFFAIGGIKLKSETKLKPELLEDHATPLKLWLDVLLTDPAQVMKNHPEIIDGLSTLLKLPSLADRSTAAVPAEGNERLPSSRTDITTSAKRPSIPKERTIQPRLPLKPAVVATPKMIAPSPAPLIRPKAERFSDLGTAVRSMWGETAAEIDKNWPKAESKAKPTPGVLFTLATDPERALAEDSKLLHAVFRILEPVLPRQAYPQKLQAKLPPPAPNT